MMRTQKIKDYKTIAFLGDSITQAGGNSGGYCRLVIDALLQNGFNPVPIYTGVAGNKSNDMLARLEKDVLRYKPDCMTLSCGVNDVWHGENGVSLEDYKKNITEILDKCKTAEVDVIILTATMIMEDANHRLNRKLVPYNEFLRETAEERKLPLADLNIRMRNEIDRLREEDPSPGNKLTSDGVHMQFSGNKMMAFGVLEAMGISPEFFSDLEDRWNDIPNAVDVTLSLSQNNLLELQEILKEYPTIQLELSGMNTDQDYDILKRQTFEAYAKFDEGNTGFAKGFADLLFDDSSWKPMMIPGSWIKQGVGGNGVCWIRIPVTIPAQWEGCDLVLELGGVDKHDTTYFNNTEVGATGEGFEDEYWNMKRIYTIPSDLVKVGNTLISIRAYSFLYDGGFTGIGEDYRVYPVDRPDLAIALCGEYRAQMEVDHGIIEARFF